METISSDLTMHENTGTEVKKKGSRWKYLQRKEEVVEIPDLNITECVQDYIKRRRDLRKSPQKIWGLDLQNL